MEPAKIDWKNVESIFVEEELYENIHAPKWFDFLANEHPVDDEAWFCRPDCKHPKTAEDFFKFTPTSKFSGAGNKSRSPLSDRNQRDGKLKRRGQSQASFTSCNVANFSEDGENRNPNLSTPSNQQPKTMKALIKSSSEKNKPMEDDDASCTDQAPRLKSTLSARNLFAGKDILSHITEFCTELKKMATRAREREDDEKESQNGGDKDVRSMNEGFGNVLGELNVKDKERKPLLDVRGEKSMVGGKEGIKEKQRRLKRVDDAENIPVSLNLSNIKQKGEDRVLQIRTNPPSPQCFSANREPARTTPSKASKSRLMEKGILQEVKPDKEMKKSETLSVVDGRGEPRGLDVFWFLKPCTLSS
ncbi:hypothetical protein Tsubulata_002268 [Turnera subulata]|uniref:Uncharacterized protein n=1 Tax=Turnera subulata TaxID=218843 RepID=A0A9Q0JF99_9ROSI|nr:hypothetical protein Tsubulata_002268 [Turnera subulata]